ncbi:TOPRIM domain protein [Thermocrinis albus DSM 14484]|uniref:TOPRIM domain protein n=1 Tax=Thermocrinis albus (strain DSM 14484 / JCM 11386 / HI 11/12) TaxID=638303 RepID=D3SNJ4_THEAH|nr:toprim domain-containing protein [Thermocrinis albus]ADC88731.1 TOPRIM domain protein [Thermocrinis albus DSM 14484]
MKAIIDDLRKRSQTAAVLVEGKRDKEALLKLGVGNIITLEGKRLTDLPDLLENFRHVISMVDLDPQGEKLHRKLRDLLTSQGYIFIEDIRERLREWGVIYMEELYEKVRSADVSPDAGQGDKV